MLRKVGVLGQVRIAEQQLAGQALKYTMAWTARLKSLEVAGSMVPTGQVEKRLASGLALGRDKMLEVALGPALDLIVELVLATVEGNTSKPARLVDACKAAH
jgi:hypothetical protein